MTLNIVLRVALGSGIIFKQSLTFDNLFVPEFDLLALNFCNTSGVTCLNSVLNLSEITFSPCNFRGWGTTDKRFSGCVDPTSPNLATT